MQVSADIGNPVVAEDVAEQLLGLFESVLRRSSGELYELLDELDLTMTHARVLHKLAELDETLQMTQLAHEVGLSLPATSRVVEALMRRALVERLEDPDDRRCRLVGLSSAGRAAVHRVDRARLAGMSEYVETLTPHQRERLSTMLAELPLVAPPSR